MSYREGLVEDPTSLFTRLPAVPLHCPVHIEGVEMDQRSLRAGLANLGLGFKSGNKGKGIPYNFIHRPFCDSFNPLMTLF